MATLYITSTANTGTGTLRTLWTNATEGDVIQPDPTLFPAGTVCSVVITENLTETATRVGVTLRGAQTRIEIKTTGNYNVAIGNSNNTTATYVIEDVDFINLTKKSLTGARSAPVVVRYGASYTFRRCRVVGCSGGEAAGFGIHQSNTSTAAHFLDCAVYGNRATSTSAAVATAFHYSNATMGSNGSMYRCTYGGSVYQTSSPTHGAFHNTPSNVGDYVPPTQTELWRTPPAFSETDYSSWTKDSWKDMDPRLITTATSYRSGSATSSPSILDIDGNARKTNGAKGAWEFFPYEQLATPTGLTASNIGETSLTLSWSAVANASSYKITYGNNEVTTIGTSADITGLTASTSYTFQIVAADDWYLDSDAATTTATTTTAKIKLATPTILNHSCGANGLTLTFSDESGDASGFRIDVLVSGTVVATQTINSGSATSGTVQYAGFTYGTTYTVYLTALAESNSRYKDSDPASASITWTYQTPQLDPFTSSTLKVQDKDDSGTTSNAYLTATTVRIVYYNNDANFSSVNFKWKAHADANYGTEHTTSGTYDDVTCGTYASGYWSGWGWIEITGLTPNTAYDFTAQALSSDSECLPSVYSDALEFTTAAPTQLATPSINGYPRASGDTKYTTLQIRLAATIANATTYEYQIATNSSFTEGLLTKTSSTVSSGYPMSGYFTGLVEGTRYYCRARAKTSNPAYTDSNWSSTGNTTVTAHLPTPVVTVSNITSSSATLAWPSSNAASYTIKYRPVGSSTWTTISGYTAYSKTLTSLTDATEYEFEVTAVGNDSTYTTSDAGTGTFTTATAIETLPTPTNLSASNITHNSATVSWGAVANASGYKVEYRASGASTWTSQTVNS